MNAETFPPVRNDARPVFTEEEIKSVRGKMGDGLFGTIPARCYHDPAIYEFEKERILKRNWLAVGRWDWAENPGDYFTLTMFGEPLVIVRDKTGELHCLVNACRHRWSTVVDEGSGNASLLVCPYHRWTYNLDGTLRGVSVKPIEGFDRSKCALPSIRLEVWEGTIFLNFDPDAAPLAPQLAGLDKYIGRFKLGEMRTVGKTEYETSWNYKYSFETGYEAYHHAGVHKERIGHYAPPEAHAAIDFGENWGIYGGRIPAEYDTPEIRFPFGIPPWMSEKEANDKAAFRSMFIAVYPGLITFISPHQISMITSQHVAVDRNISATHISVSPWALEREGGQTTAGRLAESMKDVQEEDTYACQILQKGVNSSFNTRSVIHPEFEPMLPHYHQWMLDQYMNA